MMFGVLYLKFQMFLNSEVVVDSGICYIILYSLLFYWLNQHVMSLAVCHNYRLLVNSLFVYDSWNTQ